jgi:hypothetical protein
MTKSIFEKITLNTTSDKALYYAHSSEYAKKRELSQKDKKPSSSIRHKKLSLKKLLG